MLTFGKSRKNVRGLIGRKWFDRMVGVGFETSPSPVISFEDRLVARWIENNKPKTVARPQKTKTEDFIHLKFVPAVIKKSKNPDDQENEVETIEDESYLHNLDGEEKLERAYRRYCAKGPTERGAKSWKSCGEKNVRIYISTSDLETAKYDTKPVKIGGKRFKARKSWAIKKPGFHSEWTIGEEMSAGYLQHEREEEAYREYIEDLKFKFEAFLREDWYYESQSDAEYFDEVDLFDELEARYQHGEWCIEGREADDTFSYDQNFERDLLYNFGESDAWQQAAA